MISFVNLTGPSAVGSPTKQKFLGFCISPTKQGARLRPHRQAKLRIKAKLKQITKRNRGRSLDLIMHEIRQVMTGWLNYYGIGRMKKFIHGLNQWLKHRLRQYAWKQWKKIGTKIVNLIKLGISRHDAWIWANTRKGYWAVSGHGVVNYSMKNEVLARWGYQDIHPTVRAHSLKLLNRRIQNRTYGSVRGR
ncbi:hypothetical protein FGL77_14290 [Loigolactobacillus coryniformis]|uniref:Group II intron maturase-specific domain-containing protein n=1 Tax=Loigolactobacillus coryniformis TaxID=1610 RepID=A0A5B8TR32_9LACO|nr:hypothetical protein FGL77_14290 [Loigolactobacillus coryniformis]